MNSFFTFYTEHAGTELIFASQFINTVGTVMCVTCHICKSTRLHTKRLSTEFQDSLLLHELQRSIFSREVEVTLKMCSGIH
jgi:hypothetical protein